LRWKGWEVGRARPLKWDKQSGRCKARNVVLLYCSETMMLLVFVSTSDGKQNDFF
jgi:hypothetical protein